MNLSWWIRREPAHGGARTNTRPLQDADVLGGRGAARARADHGAFGAANRVPATTPVQRNEIERESEARYRSIFDNVPVALWEQDFSAVATLLEEIRAEGVADLRAYFECCPDRLAEAVEHVRVKNVNAFAMELFEADSKDILLRSLSTVLLPETKPVFVEELVTLWEGRRRIQGETVVQSVKGRRLDVAFTVAFEGDRFEHTLVSVIDISARKSAERAVEWQTHKAGVLDQLAKTISSELDLERIVQRVTDAATGLTSAKFGAFFYNVMDEQGERYTLYTLSGVPRAAFENFSLPRNTAVFDPTFRGLGIIRSDDIRADRRYGKNAPYFGMPKGHLPVVSYLAVPVMSRSGEVHGGLFFGHDQPGIFTEEAEQMVAAIASHAAIAIDNVRLFQAAQLELDQRRHAEIAGHRLAAIVESSDDAILAKDLNGVITSWNEGAGRLFGYTAEEVIGKPVTMLIPEDHHDEEPTILARIRRGERIDHYETVRVHKDGSLIDISLTISPIKGSGGEIVGASKIARDITERRRAEEQQLLLLKEMDHRVKNLFAVSSGVVTLSAQSATSVRELASAVRERLGALARAHALTLPEISKGERIPVAATTLRALVNAIASPFDERAAENGSRVAVSGPDFVVAGAAVTSLALLLHEFATNAAKYGALSTPEGRVAIECEERGGNVALAWIERGGPPVELTRTDVEGFGSVLARMTVQNQLGGEISRDWQPEGLTIHLSINRQSLTGG